MWTPPLDGEEGSVDLNIMFSLHIIYITSQFNMCCILLHRYNAVHTPAADEVK